MDQTTFTKICREKLTAALTQYNLSDILRPEDVEISCNIKGRVAGRAGFTNRHGYRSYFLQFNAEAVEKYTEEMVTDTIAHEIAHIICYVRPQLGNGHDAGWKRVCRSLGGDDSRTHHMKLSPGKTVTKFQYNINGKVIEVSARAHKRITEGASYRVNRCGTLIEPNMVIGKVVNKPAKITQARTPVQKPTTPPTSSGSKADQARELYKKNSHLSAAQIKQMFVDLIGLTKAGASTYYYNITKKG